MLQLSVATFVAISAAITTVVALWLARVAWRQRPAPGATILTWLTLAVAVWAGGRLWMVSAPDLALCIWGAKVMYSGMVSAPVLLFTFVLVYTGFDRRLNRGARPRRWLWLPLWIVPGVTLLAVVTYPWQYLHWAALAASLQGCSVTAYGPWFPVHMAYTILTLIGAVLVLSWYAFSVRGGYRRTALIVAAALFAPLALAVGFVAQLPYGRPIDWTYLGGLIGVIVVSIAVQRGSFLDVRPIIFDQLMEQMADGILVIDGSLRVVDCNRAALVDLGLASPPLGSPLPEVIGRFLEPAGPAAGADRGSADQLLETLRQTSGSDGYLVVTQPALRHFHWRLTPLGDPTGSAPASWILAWRDVTQERLKLAMLYEQERALTLLVERQRQENEQAAELRATFAELTGLGESAMAALEQGDIATGVTALARLLAAGQRQQPAGERLRAAPLGQEKAQLTFLAALELYLHDYGQAIGCTVDFVCADAQIPGLLSPWLLVQLVRIMQETLDTLRRHVTLQFLHVALTADAEAVSLGISCIYAVATPEPEPEPADESKPAPAPEPDDHSTWLDEESLHQRLLAASGQLRCERLHATACRVTLRLPHTLPRRLSLLRQQRVILATLQPATARGVSALLGEQEMQVIGVVHNFEELIAQVGEAKPQLVLVELSLIQGQLAGDLRRLRRGAGNAKIIVLTAAPAGKPGPAQELMPAPEAAVRYGADGCLQVDQVAGHFVAALANLLADNLPLATDLASELLTPAPPAGENGAALDPLQLGLTDRQLEILTLSVRGFTYREIAVQLYMSERTVRYAAQEIRERMHVASRAAMIRFAIQHNLVKPQPDMFPP